MKKILIIFFSKVHKKFKKKKFKNRPSNIFSTYYEVHARTNNFQFGSELTEEKKIAQKTQKNWVTVPLIELGQKKLSGKSSIATPIFDPNLIKFRKV